MKDTTACRGCREDFYNDSNPYGIRRCWNADSATVILRRRVGMSEVPPWTAEPQMLPSCYRQSGAIFVDPTVTS